MLKNDLNKKNIPANYNKNPVKVNKYQPRMINKKPLKKRALPFIFDSRVKKPRAFFTPTKATTPMIKEI